MSTIDQHLDESEAKRLAREVAVWKSRYELIVAASGQVAYEYDVATGRVLWVGNTEKVLGYRADEMSGGVEQWKTRIHPEDRPSVVELLEQSEKDLTDFEAGYRLRSRDGEYRWLQERGRFLKNEQDGALLMIGMIEDVTERKILEQELERQARTDSLTGALTRRHFLAVAEQELARAMRYNRPLAVMMVDVDHFKDINDSHGHYAGDMTLQKLVELCWESLRHVDSVGRLGGEEFAVLLPETEPDQANEIAERLRSAVERSSLPLESRVVLRFTISVGVAAYKGDADMYSLMRRADLALYEAKKAGRNRISVG